MPSNRVEIMREIGELGASYPNIELKPETVRVYTDALADFSLSMVRKALGEARFTCKFFPSIAELMEILRRFQREEMKAEEMAQASRPVDAISFKEGLEVMRPILKEKFGMDLPDEIDNPAQILTFAKKMPNVKVQENGDEVIG